MKFSLTFAVTAFVALVHASNVVDLTPENFDQVIGTGTPGLVEFFAPWCGHCKNLAPVYEQLADAFAHAKDKVIIAKVDADTHKDLGKRFDISGYPTLKYFDPKGKAVDYNGERDIDTLAAYVAKTSGTKSNIKPPPPPAVVEVKGRTFEELVLNNDKDVLVTFTAPWCGHCKALKPTYEKVAQDFITETNCVVANIDADNAGNRPAVAPYDIKSFPTIMFFPKGDKANPIKYDGPRSEEAFVEYLNEKCGTHRSPGGLLNNLAGLIPDMDNLAQKFFTATDASRKTVHQEAIKLSKTVGEGSKHYLRIMEKVLSQGEAYLEKEGKRLAAILEKRSLAPAKLDEMRMKANILAKFAVEKVEEVKEEVEDVIKKATGEL